MLEVKVSIIRVHNNCSIKEIYQDISLLEYTTVVSNRYIRISVYQSTQLQYQTDILGYQFTRVHNYSIKQIYQDISLLDYTTVVSNR